MLVGLGPVVLVGATVLVAVLGVPSPNTVGCTEAVLPLEKSDQDIQWTRIVELDLVPHPDQPYPEIAEMDYPMVNGVLKMRLRAATAGYILRKWSVDCSPDHSLRGPEYRLWLRDSLSLYGVGSATLAPGYRKPAGMDSVAKES